MLLIALAIVAAAWAAAALTVVGLCAAAADGDRALARGRLHVAAAQHVADRAQQKLHVLPQGPVGHV
jgi:hypothetical protein